MQRNKKEEAFFIKWLSQAKLLDELGKEACKLNDVQAACTLNEIQCSIMQVVGRIQRLKRNEMKRRKDNERQ